MNKFIDYLTVYLLTLGAIFLTVFACGVIHAIAKSVWL